MAVSRAAIERAGLLDEDLFAYVEDVDWSLRIREAGFEVLFVPDAPRLAPRVGLDRRRARSTHTSTTACATRSWSASATGRSPRPLAALRRGAVVLATFVAHALGRPSRRAALRAVRDGYRDARAGRLGERPPVAGR